jgi:hypothetical protein
MELIDTDAQELALSFLMEDLGIAADDREWFTVLSSRFVGESWYVVEIGVEGLPDKWSVQVYDTGECDPNYTFTSPIKAANATTDLADLPEHVAEILATERNA